MSLPLPLPQPPTGGPPFAPAGGQYMWSWVPASQPPLPAGPHSFAEAHQQPTSPHPGFNHPAPSQTPSPSFGSFPNQSTPPSWSSPPFSFGRPVEVYSASPVQAAPSLLQPVVLIPLLPDDLLLLLPRAAFTPLLVRRESSPSPILRESNLGWWFPGGDDGSLPLKPPHPPSARPFSGELL